MTQYNLDFIKKIKDQVDFYEQERLDINSQAIALLKKAKKTIFELQRSDMQAAEALLFECKHGLLDFDKKYKKLPVLRYEGPVRNAFEEFVEARLFYTYLKSKEIDKIEDLDVEYSEYIGGICDFTGELVRKATLLVIDGKYDDLQEYYDIMKQIMAELLECNLTSYLRIKFDQMKRNVRKMEQIMYDISLK